MEKAVGRPKKKTLEERQTLATEALEKLWLSEKRSTLNHRTYSIDLPEGRATITIPGEICDASISDFEEFLALIVKQTRRHITLSREFLEMKEPTP